MKNFDLNEILRTNPAMNAGYKNLSSETASYLKGVELAQPIQVIDSFGSKHNVFEDSNYIDFRMNSGLTEGKLSDPISGRTVQFNDAESFAEAQRLLEDIREEELEKQLHEKVMAQLNIMISSAGSPDQTESNYKNAVSSLKLFANKLSIFAGIDFDSLYGDERIPLTHKDRYENLFNSVQTVINSFDEGKKDAVVDAVKANTSFMSLAELREFASRFPGLSSVLRNRLALIKKAGMDPLKAQFKSGHELSDLITENKRNTVIDNLRERSDSIDFGKVRLNPLEQSKKDLRDKLDWYPTIDIA